MQAARRTDSAGAGMIGCLMRSRSLGCRGKDAWAGTWGCKRSKDGGVVARTLKVDWVPARQVTFRLSRLRVRLGGDRSCTPSSAVSVRLPEHALPSPTPTGRYALCSIFPGKSSACEICASSSRRASFVAFDMAIACFDLAEAPQHLVECTNVVSLLLEVASTCDSGDHHGQRKDGLVGATSSLAI